LYGALMQRKETMAAIANTLRDLHRIHQNLTELRDRLERGPRQIKAGEANIARLERELDEQKQKHRRIRMTADEKELQLKEREQRIIDIRNKLNSCSTNKEYQTFIEQIAADEQANSVLSDEILELFDKVNAGQRLVKEAEGKVAQGKEDLKKLEVKVASQKESLIVDIQRLEQQLAEAEANVPTEIREDYKRVVRALGPDALAPVEGETCGGCFQTLRPQMLNELALGKAVFCPCGRILYTPEDTSV
jgi:predicted  nucleic acid-binding Zn-ribbon protein